MDHKNDQKKNKFKTIHDDIYDDFIKQKDAASGLNFLNWVSQQSTCDLLYEEADAVANPYYQRSFIEILNLMNIAFVHAQKYVEANDAMDRLHAIVAYLESVEPPPPPPPLPSQHQQVSQLPRKNHRRNFVPNYMASADFGLFKGPLGVKNKTGQKML